ncbi:MAG: guanosine-3',5'-bis(diphosphate) 3'-pyrophosphohydrolase [bacterium]|jgi:guanosine-3',5'-bis(diphosphate) 3'-pyrophosphohydrolase
MIVDKETAEEYLDECVHHFLSDVKNLKDLNIQKIQDAVAFGRNAHEGQYRKSGECFFIHPIRVAQKLMKYDVDTSTIIASLLHDVIEDTHFEYDEIEEIFGRVTAKIVDGLTKVKKDKKLTLNKIFQVGYQDFRIILIKLLDRLDNLSDLSFLARHKQRRICSESITIYAEVAHGLGLIEIEETIKDLVFQNLYSHSYYKVSESISRLCSERRVAVQKIVEKIESSVPRNLLAKIEPQYVTPQKYLFTREEILQVLDSVVLQTKSPHECYSILGYLHTQFRSIPLAIRDYISNPKANGWRGLETRLIVKGESIPVVIVTEEFHEKNRLGVLTLLKENIYQNQEYQKFIDIYRDITSHDNNLRIEDIIRENKERVIQVMTPLGDMVALRYGSTVADFAFTIHSQLGLHCAGGLIDDVRYPRTKILEDGSLVTIITSKSVTPKKQWLNFLVMPRARKELLKWLSRTK